MRYSKADFKIVKAKIVDFGEDISYQKVDFGSAIKTIKVKIVSFGEDVKLKEKNFGADFKAIIC